MANLFIAQPMHGLDDKHINQQREAAFKAVQTLYPNVAFALIDQFNLSDEPEWEDLPETSLRMRRLNRSLGMLAEADYAIFLPGWESAKGCQVERTFCEQYDIRIIDNEELKEWLMLHREPGDNYELIFPELGKPTDVFHAVATWQHFVHPSELGVSMENEFGLEAGEFVWVLHFPITSYSQCIKCEVKYVDGIDDDVVALSYDDALEVMLEMDNLGDVVYFMRYNDFMTHPLQPNLRENFEKELDKLYPVCVISDRYGGCYSGGTWTAWTTGISNIPEGVFEDDVTCGHTWGILKQKREKGEIIFGVGNTADEALADLVRANRHMYEKQDGYASKFSMIPRNDKADGNNR